MLFIKIVLQKSSCHFLQNESVSFCSFQHKTLEKTTFISSVSRCEDSRVRREREREREWPVLWGVNLIFSRFPVRKFIFFREEATIPVV